VSAHKALLARRGAELELLAEENGAVLRSSGAVGGALPALECVRRVAARGPLQRIDGVLNATSNLLLTLGESGGSLAEGLERARALGLVERDPIHDLDGTDAVAKLVLLVRAGFGVELDPDGLPRVSVDEPLLAKARRARAGDGCLRLVARACRAGARVTAELAAVRLGARHALAARGLENRLVVTACNGESEVLRATGAGRGPTRVAVLADLLDLWRAQGAAQLAARPAARFPAREVRA
jgi:homoserine dehydrogenase